MNLSFNAIDITGNAVADRPFVLTALNSTGVITSGSLIAVGDSITKTSDTNGTVSGSFISTNYKVELIEQLPQLDSNTVFYIDSGSNLISASQKSGSIDSVTFNTRFIDQTPFPVKKVKVTPQDTYPAYFSGSIVTLESTSSLTDDSGNLTLSLIPGIYLCEFYGQRITTSGYINVAGSGSSVDASTLFVVKPSKGVKVKVSNTDNSFVPTLEYANAHYLSVGTLQPSASYALTASHALNGGGSSLTTGSTYPVTSSWAQSANYLKGDAESTTIKLTGFINKGYVGTPYSNFIGYQAGLNATLADNSNFIGYNAGYDAIDATNSIFIGGYAGYQATTSDYSIFIGDQSGYQSTVAYSSVFIGQQAGYRATNAAKSIFIGGYAGWMDTVDNTISGVGSVLIGNNTRTYGYQDSITIGLGCGNSKAKQINIGNSIYISGSYISDTPSNTVVTTARIGIGIDLPTETLHVNGNIKCNDIIANPVSTWAFSL